MARVLLVDDRGENRQSIAQLLTESGYQVRQAGDVTEAVAALRLLPFDLVLTDMRMEADDDGIQLLQAVRTERPDLPVIVYSGFPRVTDAVSVIKLGASDYLEFPLDPDQILLAVSNAVAARRCVPAARDARAQLSEPLDDVVAASPAMRAVFDWVARIARTDIAVLLTGETGTGKELVARTLHAQSDRRARPFVPVNCGAIPEGLTEAELFGYRRGAFTGAVADKVGLVEQADGGTLFLDEIGEVTLATQVRLLRFLEDGEVRRLGEVKSRRVDVRVIAATNCALRDEVAGGRFRADLFFRLNVASRHLPPLRERPEDVDALVERWVPRLAAGVAPGVRSVSPCALALLRAHTWPGNVRELRNVLKYAVSLATGELLTEQDLAPLLGSESPMPQSGSVHPTSEDDRDRLLAALNTHHWNHRRTAASLGISRTTLWRRLRRHGICSLDSDHR